MFLPLVFAIALFAGNQDPAQSSPAAVAQVPSKDSDEAVHKQMEDLIKSVEVNLHRVDAALYAAAAGRKFKEPVSESGMSSLIQQAEADGQGAQRDMLRILELAAKHVHKSGPGAGT